MSEYESICNKLGIFTCDTRRIQRCPKLGFSSCTHTSRRHTTQQHTTQQHRHTVHRLEFGGVLLAVLVKHSCPIHGQDGCHKTVISGSSSLQHAAHALHHITHHTTTPSLSLSHTHCPHKHAHTSCQSTNRYATNSVFSPATRAASKGVLSLDSHHAHTRHAGTQHSSTQHSSTDTQCTGWNSVVCSLLY